MCNVVTGGDERLAQACTDSPRTRGNVKRGKKKSKSPSEKEDMGIRKISQGTFCESR